MFKELFLLIVTVTTLGTVTAQAQGVVVDKSCSNTVISDSKNTNTYKLIQSCEYLIMGDVRDINTAVNDTVSAKGIIDPEDLKGISQKYKSVDIQTAEHGHHKDDCIAQRYKK